MIYNVKRNGSRHRINLCENENRYRFVDFSPARNMRERNRGDVLLYEDMIVASTQTVLFCLGLTFFLLLLSHTSIPYHGTHNVMYYDDTMNHGQGLCLYTFINGIHVYTNDNSKDSINNNNNNNHHTNNNNDDVKVKKLSSTNKCLFKQCVFYACAVHAHYNIVIICAMFILSSPSFKLSTKRVSFIDNRIRTIICTMYYCDVIL